MGYVPKKSTLESIIKQSEMQSYLLKKKEFDNALKNVKSKRLKALYGECADSTESCFSVYTNFSDNVRLLLDRLEAIEKQNTELIKTVISPTIEGHKTLKQIYDKYDGDKSVISSLLNVENHILSSADAAAQLMHIASELLDISQNIVEGQVKILLTLIEFTFNILFVYIFRMNRSNIKKNAIKEILSFSAGIIPLLGPFASGVLAIINTINEENTTINSTDETIHYLESYIEICKVWSRITEAYIQMFIDWEKVLRQHIGEEPTT